ncbi:hypothetical protein GOV11_04560 [Candidatus Woesearchaeota archaeon]|nr:hypothetical protein [Candidatus Woesearchaeota archaeon]
MSFRDSFENFGFYVGAYLGVALAVNVIAMPVVTALNGIERLTGEKSTYSATVESIECTPVPYDNIVCIADLLTSEGERISVHDAPDILEGKFLPWTMRKIEEGKTYDVEIMQSILGNNLLSAEPRD